MPAVRAISWATTTVATGTTLTIPLPEYSQNDLLLAIIESDITTAATWTASGWTHVTGSPSNTGTVVEMAVMWKIAAATEATDPVIFTSGTAESYNGCIISIQDVNTSTPFGSTAVVNFVSQASAAKFNMQQITTNTANSLVIYAFANSNVGVPSILEGPVYGLLGADGIAESLGVGWTFQPTAGLTPANVGVSNSTAGAGIKLALQVVPPAGGATVIPTYCAGDSSVYIDPINGTTAFNGNTGLASTSVVTNWGSTVGGKTHTAGTVSAVADVGINSFHSAGRIATSTTKNAYGAEVLLVAANRPSDFAGKNLLVHVGPSTEGQLQNFSSVASGGGIWMGMRSGAATNYKIWQVYGNELGSLRHQPIVINPSALNTKASVGTLATTAVTSIGFWVFGTGAAASSWDFASMWLVDTVTVAGGNAANPVKIKGIVQAAATGHERKSCVLQGANQMLAYQPIQFGNGGTNPIYLDLDATAIEFPRQYNESTAEVTYNSIDNYAGITYYAGASDTIKHRNSVVSSSSKYKWGFNASTSTSATYDFSGLSVIGAGTVALKSGITLSNVTFSGCSEIPAIGTTLTNCTFNATAATGNTGALNIASPTEMAAVTNCTFKNNTSYGINLSSATAQTYTFSGITFSGNTKDVYVAATTGTVTINIVNGGSTPTVTSAGATVVVNNSVTLTLTGIVNGSEVRIYSRDGSGNNNTELSGVESVTGNQHQYTYSYVPGTAVNIVVFNTSYQYYTVTNYTLGSTNATLPIQQIADRQYLNPA